MAPSVRSFFSSLYWSTAETLPHKLTIFDKTGVALPNLEALYKALGDATKTRGPLDELCGPKGLACRALPPGKLADLYRLYQVSCGTCCASDGTFAAVWREGWSKVLTFRKASTHTICTTCENLKTTIHRSRSLRMQIEAQASYYNHLRDQWADRCIYWGLRLRAKLRAKVCLYVLWFCFASPPKAATQVLHGRGVPDH
jgi:hypothetical protein